MSIRDTNNITIRHEAQPVWLEGGDTGVLLLHGFTSTPYELDPLTRFLHQLGYTVHAPLLAGHGTTPEEMERTTYRDWVRSAQEGFEKLSTNCRRLYVGGLSMGGAIALHLAARHETEGVFSMCAPIFVTDKRARWTWLLKYFRRFQHKTRRRPEHIQRYLIGYDRTPLRSVTQLMRFLRVVRKDLAKIHVPALVLQSERDETVQPHSAQFIYEKLGTAEKALKRYPQSGHILTVDVEREQVFAEIAAFLNRGGRFL